MFSPRSMIDQFNSSSMENNQNKILNHDICFIGLAHFINSSHKHLLETMLYCSEFEHRCVYHPHLSVEGYNWPVEYLFNEAFVGQNSKTSYFYMEHSVSFCLLSHKKFLLINLLIFFQEWHLQVSPFQFFSSAWELIYEPTQMEVLYNY